MFILPSRGRPHNIQRLIDAYVDTEATAPIHVLLDDDRKGEIDKYFQIKYPVGWLVIARAERIGPLELMRLHYERWPNEPFYGHLNDDTLPQTKHWDREL